MTTIQAAPVRTGHARRPELHPVLSGSFSTDRSAVRQALQLAGELLARLPEPAERSRAEQVSAIELHQLSRGIRQQFLARYAEGIYSELTDGYRLPLRLDELAGRAAEQFPGLVPTRELLGADARRSQRTKEGWEIDLGLFFHAVLDDDIAGPHLLRSMLRPTPRALAVLEDFRRAGQVDLGLATVSRQDGIATLELANLRYLNAEDDDAVEALETGTDLVLLDDASRVGVLRGAAMTHPAYAGRRVFNAGINLTRLFDGGISLLGFLLRREAGYISKFARGLALDDRGVPGADGGDGWWPAADKPWIGAVDEFAIGGGMQILPVLDRVVAAEDAWFSLPALEEGLIPGVSNLRLARVLGGRLARDFVFGGLRVTAGSPQGRLLVDQAVPADQLDGAVRSAAGRMDNPAVLANRRMLLQGEEPLPVFRRYLAKYALEQSYRLYSADLIEKLERTWISRSAARRGARS